MNNLENKQKNSEAENQWHKKPIFDVFEELQSGEGGLSEKEAEMRLKIYGQNVLPEAKVDSLAVIFFRQFQSSLIYVLLAACAAVFLLGKITDGMVILFVLIFNAAMGTIQEGRARNTLLALRKFTEGETAVLRNGAETIVSDKDIVPGDVLILREGEKIAADARITSASSLKIDEAAITGESNPVHKISNDPTGENLLVAERKNMVFRGTNVLVGSGRAIVVAIGAETEIGKIARKIFTIDSEAPLKADIRRLSKVIIGAVIFINFFLLTTGLFTGKKFGDMFMIVVSLSVSVIPEGLPVVTTLILATGVWRMSKRNVLVKRLQAVESLGQAEVIALDKTGTITKNQLVVNRVFVNGKFFEVEGVGYNPEGSVKINGKLIEPINHPEFIFAAKNAALCSGARVVFSEETGEWSASGDPTEAALLVLSQKTGFHKNILENEYPVVMESPFDYVHKYRLSLRKSDGKNFLIVLGAPETVLSASDKIWRDGKSHSIQSQEKKLLEKTFEKMSREGLRVIALAVAENARAEILEKVKGISFIGFFGMKDVLRPDIRQMIEETVGTGIRVVMITGDHKMTAVAIAEDAGIYKSGDGIINGHELEKMSDAELAREIGKVSVFARVAPEHKLRIINAFRKAGKIVAMTGDGVNDAPSLVAADLGVAMGKMGTEVAREASDIVLLDDNFSSIVAAIEEGRSIYKNIKKVILYLFSTGLGEVFTIAAAVLAGYPLPILPAQIIWLNFVTDGFLDVALAMEPREKNLLSQKFRKRKGRFLVDFPMLKRMLVMALPMAVGTLLIFRWLFEADLAKAQTMSLVVLAVFQWFNAWNCRSDSESVFKMKFFSNKFLVGATVIVIILQLLAVYNPFLQKVFHTVPLGFSDWLLATAAAFSVIIIEELRKLISGFFSKIPRGGLTPPPILRKG